MMPRATDNGGVVVYPLWGVLTASNHKKPSTWQQGFKMWPDCCTDIRELQNMVCAALAAFSKNPNNCSMAGF
jgi:hypothetical protein